MAKKIWLFKVVRFNKVSDSTEVVRLETQYQVIADGPSHAFFSLGATYHRYEMFNTEEDAIAYCNYETDARAIVFELVSITG